MDTIKVIPKEISTIIPKFSGAENTLNLFIRKCEYVIASCQGGDNPIQDLYIFHTITSRLRGRAAELISERDDIETWDDLKTLLVQHFSDPRTEACIAIELESLKIRHDESYLDFCNRIRLIKSTLFSKVNQISDIHLKESKTIIYNNLALNAFLYNLPEDIYRLVRLKGAETLEDALSVVLEEVNFQNQYNAKNSLPLSQRPLVSNFPHVNNNITRNTGGFYSPYSNSMPAVAQSQGFGLPGSALKTNSTGLTFGASTTFGAQPSSVTFGAQSSGKTFGAKPPGITFGSQPSGPNFGAPPIQLPTKSIFGSSQKQGSNSNQAAGKDSTSTSEVKPFERADQSTSNADAKN